MIHIYSKYTSKFWHIIGHVPPVITVAQLLPGVGHVRLSSLTFLEPELRENPHQHHDGHHSADNVHNHVRPVAVGLLVDLSHWCRRPPSVGPHWCVVVGAGRLVQAVDLELAAEAVEARAAAEQVDTSIAVERRVPLAHDVVVAPTAVDGGGERFVLLWRGCG